MYDAKAGLFEKFEAELAKELTKLRPLLPILLQFMVDNNCTWINRLTVEELEDNFTQLARNAFNDLEYWGENLSVSESAASGGCIATVRATDLDYIPKATIHVGFQFDALEAWRG